MFHRRKNGLETFFLFCFLRALSYVGYYAERGLQMPLGVKGVSFLYGMIGL